VPEQCTLSCPDSTMATPVLSPELREALERVSPYVLIMLPVTLLVRFGRCGGSPYVQATRALALTAAQMPAACTVTQPLQRYTHAAATPGAHALQGSVTPAGVGWPRIRRASKA
jgi:hypothetical protein